MTKRLEHFDDVFVEIDEDITPVNLSEDRDLVVGVDLIEEMRVDKCPEVDPAVALEYQLLSLVSAEREMYLRVVEKLMNNNDITDNTASMALSVLQYLYDARGPEHE